MNHIHGKYQLNIRLYLIFGYQISTQPSTQIAYINMIADRALNSYSNTAINELDVVGYCDFGFAIGEVSATIPRISSSKLDLRSSKLDEVIRAFAKVIDGNDITMTKLLKSFRAHLDLLKKGGAALCLVAKDLEANIHKVESFYKKNKPGCETLASLLELERESGIHDGNVLQDPSAAIGLLWIRRSLAFQCHLFEALLPSVGQHPKDSAYEAYNKHLAPNHGWMLRKVFPASLSQMPERHVFISTFGEVDIEELDEEEESKVVRKLRALISTLQPLLAVWKDEFIRLELEDTRRV